jgi:hypothetical protein
LAAIGPNEGRQLILDLLEAPCHQTDAVEVLGQGLALECVARFAGEELGDVAVLFRGRGSQIIAVLLFESCLLGGILKQVAAPEVAGGVGVIRQAPDLALILRGQILNDGGDIFYSASGCAAK